MPKYPFTPERLDAYPEPLAELARGLEIKLLEEIVSRLKAAGQLNEVTVQDIRALRSRGIDLKEIKNAIQKWSGISEKELNKLLDDVVKRNQKYYTEVIDLAKVTKPPYLVDHRDVEAIRRQTWAAYKNITQSMGFLVVKGGRLTLLPPAEAYWWALDSAELQVMSGAISYNEAIANAVRELADKGLCVAYDKNGNLLKNRVAYESGRIEHLDVAVRRAVMTGVRQLCDKYDDQSAKYLNTRYFEMSAHSGARDIPYPNSWSSHKGWQGLIYYESEHGEPDPLGLYDDLVKSTGYGYVDGYDGVNCRHRKHVFVVGVMEPTYTKEQLANIDPPPFEFEGKTYTYYRATQKQRQIENSVRKWRRRKAGEMDEDEKTAIGARLRRLNKTYKEFSAAAGLPEQRERMMVLYYD